MKHLFIINPAAGKYDKTYEYRAQIQRIAHDRGLDYQIKISQKPGDCAQFAREAAQTGEEYRIYACGGDGTLNEVVSGTAGYMNVAVTHYAGGSGNDFIKIFDHPEPFRDLQALMDCREYTFDLVRCNDDISLNICSVGLDARVGTNMAKYKRLPFVSGSMAYGLSTVVNTLKGVAEHYRVKINGEELDGKFTLICACNGRFYGGGFNPVPTADPSDSMLDVILVTKVSRLKVATVVGKYKNGMYEQYPDLIRHIKTDSLTIICDKETPINLDGELRMAKEVNISIAKEKIRFFYPNAVHIQETAPAR